MPIVGAIVWKLGFALCAALLLFLAAVALTMRVSADDSADKTRSAREHMVRTQIEARGVKGAEVLAAMRKVPRHLFVPAQLASSAYDDAPLPIGSEQTISQPYIVAFMTESLRLKKSDKVLEIGTGSGYQAAVLAEIAGEVYSIEIVCSLADRAKDTLARAGYERVTVRCADGYQGWREHAPFDAVIVTAAPPSIPKPLVDQLAEGGRMVVPVGADANAQELVRLTKTGGEVRKETLLPVRFVPMTGPGTGVPTPAP